MLFWVLMSDVARIVPGYSLKYISLFVWYGGGLPSRRVELMSTTTIYVTICNSDPSASLHRQHLDETEGKILCYLRGGGLYHLEKILILFSCVETLIVTL